MYIYRKSVLLTIPYGHWPLDVNCVIVLLCYCVIVLLCYCVIVISCIYMLKQKGNAVFCSGLFETRLSTRAFIYSLQHCV